MNEQATVTITIVRHENHGFVLRYVISGAIPSPTVFQDICTSLMREDPITACWPRRDSGTDTMLIEGTFINGYQSKLAKTFPWGITSATRRHFPGYDVQLADQ